MTACASCGADVPASDAFCSACGRAVADGGGAPAVAEKAAVVLDAPARPPARAQAAPDVSLPPRRPVAPAAPMHDGRASSAGVVIPPADQDSELEGQAVPNQFYVGQRLGYSTGGAESLDPLNGRFIGALLLHWLIVFTIFVVGSGVIVLLGRILGSVKVMGLLLAVWWLAMGVVAWWFPIWASISEWKFMVDGKAAAAATAFQHITSGIRAAPVTGRPCQGSSSLVRQLAKP